MSDGARGFEVGYRKAPTSGRFAKGTSGNPKGRPRGKRNALPFEAVLGQLVTVREDGRERRVTAAEAFLLHMTKRGLEGDGAAARSTLAAIEEARAGNALRQTDRVSQIAIVFVTPGSVTTALEPLGLGRKLDRLRPTARIVLETWIVEAALARLGARRLSVEEQRTVFKATRTPWKVEWPAWWKVKS